MADWTNEEEATLFRLWNEGKTAGQIAYAMPGRNKDSVIGKVHRAQRMGINLQRRPSPIIRREKTIEEAPKVREKTHRDCAEHGCYQKKHRGSYCEHHANLYYTKPDNEKAKPNGKKNR